MIPGTSVRFVGHDLFNGIAKRPISKSPLCSHARQNRDQLVDIVDDQNLGLSGVLAVEATYILSQRTLPGYGHREEERVEPWIIKTLTEISPCSNDKPFLAIGYL